MAYKARLGRTKVATFTVTGAAQQNITFGTGGNVAATFNVGRRYRLEAYLLPGTVGSVNTYSIAPANLATNLSLQYIFASNTTTAAARQADAAIYGDSGNERVYLEWEWNELTGQHRVFHALHAGFDDTGPVVDSVNRFIIQWRQTPAQQAMTTMRVAGSLSDSMGIGSLATVYDMGPV